MQNAKLAMSGLPPDFPIRVNEPALTVTVAAGITQRALLDYLAAYQCAHALPELAHPLSAA